jgi:hypothetical protein
VCLHVSASLTFAFAGIRHKVGAVRIEFQTFSPA